MADAVGEANTFESFANAGGTIGTVDFGETERELDIFFEGHAREEMEGLEDHADGVAAVTGKVEGRERGDILAIGEDGAGSGAVETGNEIEKRGLAGAGRAEKCEEFVGGNRERDVVDGADAGFAHGVVAGDAVELDGGLGVGHGGQIMIRRERVLYFIGVDWMREKGRRLGREERA